MVHKDTVQSVDWIYMAHDTNQWRALVTMLFTIRLQKKARTFWISCANVNFSIRNLLLRAHAWEQ
jgi:hypothetical protein